MYLVVAGGGSGGTVNPGNFGGGGGGAGGVSCKSGCIYTKSNKRFCFSTCSHQVVEDSLHNWPVGGGGQLLVQVVIAGIVEGGIQHFQV